MGGGPIVKFLQPRGALGRTPSIWDLSIRLSYALKGQTKSFVAPKLILDMLHLGSRRTPVYLDQIRYLGIDENGNQTTPNANFLRPLVYQPPLTVRLGFELGF